MGNKIKYFSKDKMYTVDSKKKFFSTKAGVYILFGVTLLCLAMGIFFLRSSFKANGKIVGVDYNEIGKADYTVYLKENSYYDSKYLESGMQYVASLINTINTDFKYEIHSAENINYTYKYRIVGTLQIMDKDNPEKILYSKDSSLLNEVTKKVDSNNFVINENVIIDYDEYNDYVNAYKRDYGLVVDSRLVVTMYVEADGLYEGSDDKVNKSSQLQITIPLSEQTLGISIDTADINNSGTLSTPGKFDFKTASTFITGIGMIIVTIILLVVDRRIYKDYRNDNIYTLTVKKILKDYDRIIVNGDVSIQEDKYTNIVYPQEFIEMVDASQNLKAPILYYEVLPGEKCFFVIAKDDTLYKYRLTRSYLERKELEKKKNDKLDVADEKATKEKKSISNKKSK